MGVEEGNMQETLHVLKNLNITVNKGDFVVIMGNSGSGKSTLLYALSGMDRPTLGSVNVNGHDEAWDFFRLGRLLERADKTSRILDVKYFILLPDLADVGSNLDYVQWAALLKAISALEAYRHRYGRIQPDRIVEFLLLDHGRGLVARGSLSDGPPGPGPDGEKYPPHPGRA